MQNHIADLLATIAGLHHDFDSRDPEHDEEAEDTATVQALIVAYQALVEALALRAYPIDAGADDRLEHVVITVHGVDLSIRGRTGEPGDLFVHIGTDDRDDADTAQFPLIVEVDDCGEMTYGDPH